MPLRSITIATLIIYKTKKKVLPFFSAPRGGRGGAGGVVRCMLSQSAGALAWYVFLHHFASPVSIVSTGA